MGAPEHRETSQALVARCAIFVASDSKTAENDESGKAALEILSKGGHDVVELRVVKNDKRLISAAVTGAVSANAMEFPKRRYVPANSPPPAIALTLMK